MHQTDRLDFNRKSITQRAIEKHKANPQPKIVKAGRFVLPVNGVDTEVEMYEKMGIIDNGMDAFWKHAESVIIKTGCVCWNCGDSIAKNDFRNSTGHIFPKSIFLSIAAHTLNFVVVGNRCGCHNDTHVLLKFSQMSVFGTAVNRYREFCHLITEKHKYHDLFLEYANATL
jgi:hypothetical protein